MLGRLQNKCRTVSAPLKNKLKYSFTGFGGSAVNDGNDTGTSTKYCFGFSTSFLFLTEFTDVFTGADGFSCRVALVRNSLVSVVPIKRINLKCNVGDDEVISSHKNGEYNDIIHIKPNE